MTKRNTHTVIPLSGRQKRIWFFNRNHKDLLFGYILSDKKALLELYNALNNTDYHDESDLQINTMKDVVYLGYKNDLSFLLGHTLNLYEHQSTINPNMPLRGLLYIAALYESFLAVTGNKKNLYKKSLIRIPSPRCVVFYNGTDLQPEQQKLYLSDAYLKPPVGVKSNDEETQPCLEFTVTILNINYGNNRELIDKCRSLKEYSQFIDQIRYYLKGGADMKKALEMAIDDCIHNNILKNILLKNKSEVRRSFLTEFDADEYIAAQRELGVEQGLKQGQEQGLKQGLKQGQEQGLKQGLKQGQEQGQKQGQEQGLKQGLEKGMRILIEDNREEGISDQRILEKLQSKYMLTAGEAEDFLRQYLYESNPDNTVNRSM